jgi:hypothetical protein
MYQNIDPVPWKYVRPKSRCLVFNSWQWSVVTGGGNLWEVKALSLLTVKCKLFWIGTKNVIDYYVECGTYVATRRHVMSRCAYSWLFSSLFSATKVRASVSHQLQLILQVHSLRALEGVPTWVRLDFRTGSEYENCNQQLCLLKRANHLICVNRMYG